MKSDTYSAGSDSRQPHVNIGEKRYLFVPFNNVPLEEGFDGVVYPYLCTYCFTDKHLQPVATIMRYFDKQPSLMNINWCSYTKQPLIRPVFTRGESLGMYSSDAGSEDAICLLTCCLEAHHLWSSQFAESQMLVDPLLNSLTLFGKTFFIGSPENAPSCMYGVVYLDPIQGFIFTDNENKPYLSLTQCGKEQYFSSATLVNGKIISTFALNDCDIDKLGGEVLLEVHRSRMARRLYSFLSKEVLSITV
ncbi:hypothetical protein ACI0X9_003282 [Cronobacter turicensis]